MSGDRFAGRWRRANRYAAGLGFAACLFPSMAFAATSNYSTFSGIIPTLATIPANVINSFVTTIPGIVSSANSILTQPLVSFANAAIVTWTTFQLFRMLSVTHANDPAKAIDLIVNRLFLYMILVGIVNTQLTTVITSYIIPTISAMISLGASLQTASTTSVAGCPTGSGTYAALSTAADAYVCTTSQSFLNCFGIGIYLAENTITNQLPYINPGALVAGFVVMWIYGFQLLKLPIACLDALFRFAIVVILLPVFIMSYLFIPTRGFFKKGVESLIASGLSLTMTGIAAGLCTSTLNNLVGSMSSGGSGSGSILSRMNDQTNPTFLGPIGIQDFVTVVIVGLSVGSAMKLGPKLAAEFVGFSGNMEGPGSAAGAAVGGLAGQAVTAAGAAGGAYLGGSMGAKAGAEVAGAATGGGGGAKAGDATMA